MSSRSYSPFGQPHQYPVQPYAYPASVFSQQGYMSDESASFSPRPGASVSELQAFCNMARRESSESPSLSSSFHLDLDPQSQQNFETPDAGMDYSSPLPTDTDACEDDDDGADWFDMEALGLALDCDDDFDSSSWRFEFPVPTEPVVPVEQLKLQKFDQQAFYIDDEGYAQVYTQGECRTPFTGPASIGVWFGPDHPKNVCERLHRGRRTQEAARFAAVIEAIRVAGSCGVKKLQINTDYINVIRFMIYFILKWEGNDWMTVRGTSVKNQVLIRELDFFSRLLDVKWNYVPYEDGAEGNIEATLLANDALDLKLPRSFTSNNVSNSGEEATKIPRHEPIVY